MTNNEIDNIDLTMDFGFTLVDETELESYQQLQSADQEGRLAVDDATAKLNKLYNAVLPLLSNLKQSPEKEYILWPDRTEKIEQFEDILRAILNS